MNQTVIALYNNFATAREVVEALVISLIASDQTGEYGRYVADEDVSAGEGAAFGAVVGTLVGLGAAVIPGIGPIIAAGPLWAALMAGIGAASGAATGGLVAGLVDMGVDEEDAAYYSETVGRGGAMVSAWVDESYVDDVARVMERYSPASLDYPENPNTTSPMGRGGYVEPTSDYSSQTTSEGSYTMGMNSPRSYESFATDFQRHYDSAYASSGYAFNDFDAAYRYGYTLANDHRYRDYTDWYNLESQAREEWEQHHPNTWDRFKDAVRESWMRVRNTF
jgi:hypothetical protein